MATKWKNYDWSFRIIAIFLVIISAFSGCFGFYMAVRNKILFDKKKNGTVYESPYFLANIQELIGDVNAYAKNYNSEYLSAKEEQEKEYYSKKTEFNKEQERMQILLDQMLWLQNHFPASSKDMASDFNPYYFINCTSPEDYVDAFDTIAPGLLSEESFYSKLEEQSLPGDTNSNSAAEQLLPSETAPVVTATQPATTAEPMITELPNEAEHIAGQDTAAATAPSMYNMKETDVYFNESDGVPTDTLMNPAGYAIELKGYSEPSTWLYYYYSIRTYLVSKVGSPVLSDNIYNYAQNQLEDYRDRNNDIDHYYDHSLFLTYRTKSIKYFFVSSKSGEYITNIPEYLPDGKFPDYAMISSEETEKMIGEMQRRIQNSPWGFSVTKAGVQGKFNDAPLNKNNFSVDLFDLNDIQSYSADDLEGTIYLYCDFAATLDTESADVFTFCHQAFSDAQRNQTTYTQLAVFSAVIFLFTCLYIFTAGTRKTTALDKLYTEWHFLLSGVLTVAAAAGCIVCFETRWLNYNYYYIPMYAQKWMEFLTAGAAALALLILLEYLVSVVRSIRNERFIRHSSWYVFGAWLRRKAKKHADKHIKGNPVYYKKQYNITLAVGIIYTILTTALAGFATYGILLLPMLAANIVILIFLLRDIKALNLITDASEKIRNGDYEVLINMNAIPRHLQALASNTLCNRDGIKNAVEKSVKDERMKAELITNVSHDLKTPLTSVVTYVDLLKKCNITDEKARSYIDILDEKSDKLKHLVEDLVEASKASTGNIKINCMNVNLYEMALQAIGENADALEESDIQIVINDPVGETIVFADNQQTWRVIDNLFSNVKKYAMPGTRVYLDVREIFGKGVFSMKNVSKNPLNIPAEELTKRFVRGDDARGGDGSGLGLSIAKSLCELQNGIFKLDIDGDLFKATVILPKAYPIPPNSQPIPPNSQPIPPTQQPFPPAQQPTPPIQQPTPPTQQPFPSTQQPIPPTETAPAAQTN